jgi:exopolysaccharide production protein ExoY
MVDFAEQQASTARGALPMNSDFPLSSRGKPPDFVRERAYARTIGLVAEVHVAKADEVIAMLSSSAVSRGTTNCGLATAWDAASPPRPIGGLTKRVMDVGIATAMVILLCPLMVLVICLISAVMGPPILFAHRRIGHAGKVFNCYKFRTMVAAPDDILITHLERNSDAAREWQEKRKLRNDPRVTELGRILRKSSLDELPQLFNVLRGDMSCVGPRPIVGEELPLYGEHAGADRAAP